MTQFDEAVPSLGELLAGPGQQQAPNYAAPEPQQQGGFLGGAKSWLNNNPAMGMMLLGTMMAAARGHDLGNAVAEGAKFGLNAQVGKGQFETQEAERKRKQELEDKRLGFEEQRAANEGKRLGFEEQRLGLEQQRVTQAGKTAQSQNEYYGAQTEEIRRKGREAEATAPLNRQRIEKQLAAIDEQIANSRDSRKTSALQRKRLAIQTQLDEEFGAMEREADITGKQLGNQGKVLANQKGEAEVARAAIDMADWTRMTGEQRAAALYGNGGKAPKTPSERLQAFIASAGDNYADLATGELDMPRLLKDFQEIEAYGTPQQGAAAAAEVAAQQQQIAAARAAVKPGEIYTVNGKSYRRKD